MWHSHRPCRARTTHPLAGRRRQTWELGLFFLAFHISLSVRQRWRWLSKRKEQACASWSWSSLSSLLMMNQQPSLCSSLVIIHLRQKKRIASSNIRRTQFFPFFVQMNFAATLSSSVEKKCRWRFDVVVKCLRGSRIYYVRCSPRFLRTPYGGLCAKLWKERARKHKPLRSTVCRWVHVSAFKGNLWCLLLALFINSFSVASERIDKLASVDVQRHKWYRKKNLLYRQLLPSSRKVHSIQPIGFSVIPALGHLPSQNLEQFTDSVEVLRFVYKT